MLYIFEIMKMSGKLIARLFSQYYLDYKYNNSLHIENDIKNKKLKHL